MRLFPPVTIFLDLFPSAGYFFNAFDLDQRTSKKLIILPVSGAYSKSCASRYNYLSLKLTKIYGLKNSSFLLFSISSYIYLISTF